MKYIGNVTFIAMLIGILTACSPSSSPSQNQDTPSNENKKVVSQTIKMKDQSDAKNQSSIALFDELLAASKNAHSLNFIIDITSTTTILDKNLQWTSEETIETDMTFQPFALYQKMQFEMDSEIHNLEMYLTEEDLYMYDNEDETWYFFDDEFHEEMVEDIGSDVEIVNDFSALKKFANQFEVKEKKNEYVLHLSSSGVAFKTLALELAYEDLLESLNLDEDDFDELEQIQVKDIYIVISLDKNSYQPKIFDIDLTLTAKLDGERIRFEQQNSTLINTINEIESIIIPPEVIEQAIAFD